MPEAASLTANNPMMVKIVSVDIICQMVPLALLCYLKLSITLHLDRIHGVHTFSSAAKLLFSTVRLMVPMVIVTPRLTAPCLAMAIVSNIIVTVAEQFELYLQL